MWDLNLAWKSWHKKGRSTDSFKGWFWGLKNVSKWHHSSNIWYWTKGRDQKQKEQICIPIHKIKFIEKSMKYDIGAKLRVTFTLQVQRESNPQFHPCTTLQWEGISYWILFVNIWFTLTKKFGLKSQFWGLT